MRKGGKKSGDMGGFWWGCGECVKDGVEMMGIGVIDIDGKDWMMLKGEEWVSNKEVSVRKKSMVDLYMGVIKG